MSENQTLPRAAVRLPLAKRIAREVAAVVTAALVFVLVGVGGMTAVSGCAWLKSESKTAEAALIDCAKQDLTAGSLLSEVAAALGSGTWQTALAQVGTKYGEDALACGLKAVEAVLHPAPSGSASSAEPSPLLLRASSYIQAKGYQYK